MTSSLLSQIKDKIPLFKLVAGHVVMTFLRKGSLWHKYTTKCNAVTELALLISIYDHLSVTLLVQVPVFLVQVQQCANVALLLPTST